MKTIVLLMLWSGLLISGCDNSLAESESNSGSIEDKENNESDDQSNGTGDNSWLIPRDEVRDGGPGKDGIPALSNPEFISASEVNYLDEDDLVLGFAEGNNPRAYPHAILDWHEIVNDDISDRSVAVIYCPLTGTGIGWDRIVDGEKTTFGVSGLLYNSNIIPYDRRTDSNWSQLLLKSVNGKMAGTSAKTYNLIETDWKTWKEMFPASKVVSRSTGYNRNYNRYPYGNYKSDNDFLIFPVSNKDDRLPSKERVLAVISGNDAKAYRFEAFMDDGVIEDIFQSKSLVIRGSAEDNLMVAFFRELDDGTELSFEAVENDLPIILEDHEGTTWDVFGRGVSGPRAGEKLTHVTQMMGYWFSFPAFYPEIEIYGF